VSSSCRRTSVALVTAALTMVGGTATGTARGDDIVLRISGEGGSFTAVCVLKTAAGADSFALEETLPYERSFAGNGLRCRIEAAGAFAVEVVQGSNRSRTRSSGGVVTVSVGS
jgi:hypothetical protein